LPYIHLKKILMNRRKALQSLSAASLSMPLFPFIRVTSLAKKQSLDFNRKRGSFALDGNHIRFFNTSIEKSFQITMLADTHLFTDDMRGEAYQKYSARMAKAYNETVHFQTGLPTNPEEGFRQALAIAQDEKSEMLALIGDIFSFPSEAGIEWALDELKQSGLPYLYTAGNHDWHYEGMPGPHSDLRKTWCEKRLKPLYQGENPLMGVRKINGVRFVTIDNSNYEILPEQLDFFKSQAAFDQPMVLLLHIPLYAPGRTMGYGCGHPQWGAATDKNYKIERRERWPEVGHTSTTFEFHQEVFQSPFLMGILAGHIHKPTLDVIEGIPQLVTSANATGAYLKVECIAV
jgi:hypothetical protein